MRYVVRTIIGLVFVGAALWAAPAFAFTIPDTPSGHVNDFAHVLSDETVQSIEIDLRTFAASTSNEIAVVTVPDMDGDYIEHYAVKVFEKWGIGKKERDNGVLLLIAMKEHKLRIEVGYGLEGALPDSIAQDIIDNDMTPRMKAEDYDGAVESAVRDIMRATQGEYEGSETRSYSASSDISFDLFNILIIPLVVLQWIVAILARSRSWWAGGVLGFLVGLGILFFVGLVWWIGLLLVLFLVLFGLGLDYAVSKAYTTAKSSGTTPPWWAGGSTGHSSGGSFGGFGGGSSGGGGASGGW